MGFEWIFAIGGLVLKYLLGMWAMAHILKWVGLVILLIILWISSRILINMIDAVMKLLGVPILAKIAGYVAIIAIAFGLGWCSHKPSANLKDVGIGTLNVQKRDSMTRSKALVKDGKIYYPGTFINKHLERKGIKERFKEVA